MLKSIRSLFKKTKNTSSPKLPTAPAYFDEAYYVQRYPEVLAAGMTGWQHYYRHGYSEGRWPCALQSVTIEAQLWDGESAQAEQQLLQLLGHDNEAEKSSAAWFLGRWYAAHHRWERVKDVMPFYIQCHQPVPGLLAPKLLGLEVIRRHDKDQAVHDWQQLQMDYGSRMDLSLIRMNLLGDPSHSQAWQTVNDHYRQQGLHGIGLKTALGMVLFDRLQGIVDKNNKPPIPAEQVHAIVSVIVPAYNAANTIETALQSIQAQTWPWLDIVVVDDASTDTTAARVMQLASQDARIRLIQLPTNQGAYAARNMGLAQSQGQFITVHDSDDWSHPQKIEQQVLPLLREPQLKGTLSHWVRASEQLRFGSWASPEDWNGLVHRNVSSLMISRDVVAELGFWDAVVCSADTEYYYRILTAYGPQALVEVHPGIPLALGRVRSDSLTQQSDTHIFSIFGGLRQRYRQAYEQWHKQSLTPSDLYMPQYMDTRAFAVDVKMLPKQK